MIRINGREFIREFFPDSTQRLKAEKEDGDVVITWNYENDEELFAVIALGERYKEVGNKVFLKMPYIPNARMDRIKSESEIFTLKIFSRLINSVGFERIYVLDAHSAVSLALLDKVKQMDIRSVIERAALCKLPGDIVLYFPDEGSQKRYADMFPEYACIIGMKKRDWSTGKIVGLEIITHGLDLSGRTVLMIDDIISYGGSLYYSALRLKELGAERIFAYATHTENSVLDEIKGRLKRLLDNKTVERLFTTDSLFCGRYENIEVTEV